MLDHGCHQSWLLIKIVQYNGNMILISRLLVALGLNSFFHFLHTRQFWFRGQSDVEIVVHPGILVPRRICPKFTALFAKLKEYLKSSFLMKSSSWLSHLSKEIKNSKN